MRRVDSAGFTLIEALIALVILGVVGAAFTSLMTSMSRENRSVSDVTERSDLERQLGVILSDDRLCGCNLKGLGNMVTDPLSPTGATGTYQVPMSQLTLSWSDVNTCAGPTAAFAAPGQKMQALSASFKVSKVSIRDLKPTGKTDPTTGAKNEYTGAFYVEFDPSASVSRALRPIKATKMFVTNPAGTQLISCSSASNFYVDTAGATNAPGATSFKPSVALCPSGYTVRSGGWKTDGKSPTCPSAADPRPPQILENHPVMLPNGRQGWTVVGSCVTLFAIAVCQPGR